MIEKNVLKRVRVIFAIRKIFQPMFVEVYVLILATSGLFYTSSVFNVFDNLTSSSRGPGDILSFFYGAFLNTEFIVQALSILILASALFLLKNLGQKVVSRVA